MNKKGKRFAWLLRAVCLTACLAAGLSGCGARAGSHETVQPVKSGSAQEQDTSTGSDAKAGESRNAGDMTVHFLDVGQGLSILVQSEGQTLLYDGGGRSASSLTVAYLERQGVAEIDYMISSHYDEDHVAGLIGCLNYVVMLVIVCAAALAAVVLYNLISVNLGERKKELATIKVLGFYDKEVYRYIFREIDLLSLIGSLVGLVVGIPLHQFIIRTVEMDQMMFIRSIAPRSFVFSVALTMLFNFAVCLLMRRHVRQISMVESMKAPE